MQTFIAPGLINEAFHLELFILRISYVIDLAHMTWLTMVINNYLNGLGIILKPKNIRIIYIYTSSSSHRKR